MNICLDRIARQICDEPECHSAEKPNNGRAHLEGLTPGFSGGPSAQREARPLEPVVGHHWLRLPQALAKLHVDTETIGNLPVACEAPVFKVVNRSPGHA